MIKVIADDKIPFLKGVLDSYAEVIYLPGKQISKDTAMDADALLIRTRTRCDAGLLEGTKVKFIGTATIGFDHIDTVYCEKHGIKWVNSPGCNSSSVQQYIASALLKISAETGFNLRDKTLGIVGVGHVGSKVEKLARILGMNIILNDPPRARAEGYNQFVSLDELLRDSDIISLHVPLNAEGIDKTMHLFNDATFRKVRKGSWLLNTSRGEVVNSEALKNALVDERLSGTVIDVWEKEPEIDIPLMHMAFLATPHIAGYSADGKANGTAMVVKALCGAFKIPVSDWYPDEVPQPLEPIIAIDGNGKSCDEIIRKAVFHAYNIAEDDVKLRFDPSRFERIREQYPVRREFHAFTVRLKGDPKGAGRILGEMGFKVE